MEVKNLRAWLYAKDREVWQVLRKAKALQLERPDIPVLPVLVCRRTHPQVRWMAKQLGFIVVETFANFVGTVDQADIDEVRMGLRFMDLKHGSEPNPAMISGRGHHPEDRRPVLRCVEGAVLRSRLCRTDDRPLDRRPTMSSATRPWSSSSRPPNMSDSQDGVSVTRSDEAGAARSEARTRAAGRRSRPLIN